MNFRAYALLREAATASAFSNKESTYTIHKTSIMKNWLRKSTMLAISILLVSFFISAAVFGQNYYYKGTGNLNSTANWGLNTDGSGATPSNFTTANRTFNVRNVAAVSNSGTWTVSGANSKIVVGDGTNACNLTIPTGANTIAGTIDVSASATLTITNTTIPTLGTLNAASTVVFNGTAGQSIPVETYGNLTYSGTSTGTFAGGCTIAGNFSCTSGNVTFNSSNTARTFTVTGSFSMSSSGGQLEFGSGNGSSTINLSGDFSKTNGYMVTTIAAANADFNMVGTNQTMQSTGGTILKWVDFTIANGSTCSLAGDFNMNGSSGTPMLFTVSSGGTLNTGNFSIIGTATPASNNQFILNSGGTLGIGSANGITTAGTASGSIQSLVRTYNAGANYTYNGTGNQNTGTGLPNNLTGNLTIDNPGNTVTLNNARTIANTGDIFLTNGVLAAGTNLTMASTSTINRSEGSMTGNPQGAGVYNVVYTGNNKTTGSELNGSGLNNIAVTVTSGQTVTLGAAVTMDGSMTIGSGATLDASGSNFAINIAGNWTNNGGTFNGQGGTVTFNGTGAQSINGTATSQTFNNVIVNKTAGQLLNTGGSTTTLSTNALTLTQGNFTAPATLNINGNFTHTAGTYTTGANTNVSGSWTRNGGTFTPGTNTVTFTGSSAQLINGSVSTGFYNLTINESTSSTTVTSQTTAFTVGNNLTITQGNLILQATNADYTVTNNLTVSTNGTLTHSVNWDTFSRLLSIGGNIDVTGIFTYTVRSHVQMTGTAKTIRTGTPPASALSILTLAAATVSANGTVTVNDNFWAPFNTAGSFSTNGQTVVANAGLLIAGGTVNVNGGSLTVTNGILVGQGAAINGTLNISSGSLVTDGVTLGDATGTLANTITQTGGSFTVNGAVTINQPAAGAANGTTNAWNINAGTPAVSGLISFAGTQTASRIGRIVITTGTLNANGGISFAGTTPANKVIDMSTGGGTGTINLKGALTGAGNATLTAGTSGSIFNYADNASAQTVNFFGAGAYHNLHINTTGGAGATLAAAISATNVTGNLRVQSGTLNNGGFAIVGNASRTFEVANAAFFQLGGTTSAFPTGFGTVSLGATSTVDYRGSGNQTVSAQNYGNLTTTLNGTRTITLANAGTIGIAGVFTPAAGATSYTTTSSTVSFNGTSGAQNIPGFSFNNLTINNTSGVTLTDNISVTGAANALTFTNGKITTGSSYTITLSATTTSSTAAAGKYIFGNQARIIASGTTSNAFYVGDATNYTPATIDFTGVTNSVGTLTVNTTGSDETNINTSGLIPTKTVNRFWTLAASGITPATPTYDATLTFINPGDLDGGTTPANFIIKRYSSGWNSTTVGTWTSTTTQATGIVGFGNLQIGEACTAPSINTPVVNNITCNGSTDGSIDITTTGGTTPFTYAWSNGASTEDISGLAVNTYTLNITTPGGCAVSSGPISITEPAVLNATVNSTDVTCNSAANGTITISSPAGGYGTYEYSINGGGTWQGSGSYTGQNPGTYNVQIRDAAFNTCVVVLNSSLIITEPAAVPAPVSGGDQTVCSDGNPLQTLTATATSGFSIVWYDDPSAGSVVPVPELVGPGSVIYYAEANDGLCSSLTRTAVTLTINDRPATPGAISGPVDACPLVNQVTPTNYSISAVPTATSYTWTVPVGVTLVSGQGTTSIGVTFDNSFALTNSLFKVTATNALGCASDISSLEVEKLVPAIPGTISGPTDACQYTGQPTTATYSISPVANATSYTWTVSSNATLVSGQGTTSVEVSFASNFTSGSITVTANSNCGNRAPRSLSVGRLTPAAPASISGPTDACPYIGTITQVAYSIAPVAYATSYIWTVPPNTTLVSGQGTTSILVTFNTGYVSSNMKVRAVSNCFTTGDRQLLVTGSTYNAPGAISGPTNACAFIGFPGDATYTIRKVINATQYIWTVPTGATITSHPGGLGVNDTIITVAFNNSFVSGTSIQVQSAGCVPSAPKSIVISRVAPVVPGLITGPTNVCEYMISPSNPTGTTATYTIRRVTAATSYNWTAPANATITGHPGGAGINDTIIEVTFNSTFTTGSFTVAASSVCGTSSNRSLVVTKLSPGSPSVIDIIQTITCPTRQYTYSLAYMPPNATAVNWTIPPAGTLISGQGTTSITVSYPATTIAGTVTATPVNNCGSSSTRVLNIKLPACPLPRAAKTTGEANMQLNNVFSPSKNVTVNVYPNPSVSDFKVEVAAPGTEQVTIRILDIQGRELKRNTVQTGQVISIGKELKAGNYILELVQGRLRATKKLIKL